MKWLLVLLVLLGGGVAAAAFAVPTNAAVVNGTAISQAVAQLGHHRHRRERRLPVLPELGGLPVLQRQASTLPPVTGAGKGQNPGDNPTANSAFVATYLDTEIGHELVAPAGGRSATSR